jgi:hypothetical protein
LYLKVLLPKLLTYYVGLWGRREACIWFWWGNLRESDHWRDPGVDGRIIVGWIFRKWDVGVWTGLGWLGTETLVNAVMNLRVQ